MGFCSKCGCQVENGAAFCPGCGAPQDVGGGGGGFGGGYAGAPGGPAAAAAPVPTYRAPNEALSNFQDYGPSYSGGYARKKKGGGPGADGEAKNAIPEVSAVIQGVKRVYREKILPMEASWKFPDFHSPSLTDSDLEAKPMVMLIGQYSTGKTSFIRFILEREFPGAHIGPEPTTDKFIAIMDGDERIIPGNALVVQADRPFTALTKYGMAFLNRFECSQCTSPILSKITFIDTPGILAGEKQRLNRGYDFTEVVRWFAERVDRILLLFDAHKLDISDELREAILALKGHDDKIRCILNKADGLSVQALIRVYGALMWSLGKVIMTPEVLRVYVGSFWDQPVKNEELKQLFAQEQADLLADLRSLPRNSTVRKVNELIKRARMLKVHVHLLAHLQAQFGTFGKQKTQQKMLNDMLGQFKIVQAATGLPMGDFPHLGNFRDNCAKHDLSKFPDANKKSSKKLLAELDSALSVDIPRLMRMIPSGVPGADGGGANNAAVFNPFAAGSDNAAVNMQWSIDKASKAKYDTIFYGLDLAEGKLSGAKARDILAKSMLGNDILRQIWTLADCDEDGYLDCDEFAVAMHLIEAHKGGRMPAIPQNLPSIVVPPSKRDLYDFD